MNTLDALILKPFNVYDAVRTTYNRTGTAKNNLVLICVRGEGREGVHLFFIFVCLSPCFRHIRHATPLKVVYNGRYRLFFQF